MKLKLFTGILTLAVFITLSLACASKPNVVAEDYIHDSNKDLLSGINYVVSTSPELFSDAYYSKVDKMNNTYTLSDVKARIEYKVKTYSRATGLTYEKNYYSYCHADLNISLTSANTLLISFSSPSDIPVELVMEKIVTKENFKEKVADYEIKNLFNSKLPVVMSNPELYEAAKKSVERDPLFVFLTAESLTSVSLKAYLKNIEEENKVYDIIISEVNENNDKTYGKYAYTITSYYDNNNLGFRRAIYFYTNNDKLAYSKKGDKIVCSGKIRNVTKEPIFTKIILVEE
ncbi:MAG: hypothetical protein K6F15_02240 [Treponema sp.]|nr:hypothetical protein [Treponema sp.]